MEYINKVLNLTSKSRELTQYEILYIKENYNEKTKQDIIKISTKMKRLPFIAKLFCSLNVDSIFWFDIIQTYTKRNSYMLDILEDIFDSFKKYGVSDIFVYENFGALLSSNSDISQFASGDIDLYSKKSNENLIEKALNQCGFYKKNRFANGDTINSEYYNKNLKHSFYISIMWQALSRSKLPFEIDVSNCVDWSALNIYKKTSITMPNPTTLMYLCVLHISVHGYSREPDLRLYKDIENLIDLNINWSKIFYYAVHDNKETRVLAVISISTDLLGIEIPSWENARKKHTKRVEKILSMVYDKKNETLIYSPTGIKLLKIEAYSDFSNLFTGIFHILFPSYKWIKDYYLNGENKLIKGYYMHIKNIVKR